MTFVRNEKIHLADLPFSRLCEKTFGINRGVYNTIDSWFYSKGITNILKRRNLILEFLESLYSHTDRERRFQKFGQGGLSAQLDSYWQHLGFAQSASYVSNS
jgi:riboflavin kinase